MRQSGRVHTALRASVKAGSPLVCASDPLVHTACVMEQADGCCSVLQFRNTRDPKAKICLLCWCEPLPSVCLSSLPSSFPCSARSTCNCISAAAEDGKSTESIHSWNSTSFSNVNLYEVTAQGVTHMHDAASATRRQKNARRHTQRLRLVCPIFPAAVSLQPK